MFAITLGLALIRRYYKRYMRTSVHGYQSVPVVDCSLPVVKESAAGTCRENEGRKFQ